MIYNLQQKVILSSLPYSSSSTILDLIENKSYSQKDKDGKHFGSKDRFNSGYQSLESKTVIFLEIE